MDNFKIKSIDEFDLDFITKYNEQKNNEISSVSPDSLVPENTNTNAVSDNNQDEINVSFFNTSLNQTPEQETEDAPVFQDTAPTPLTQEHEPVSAFDTENPVKKKRHGAAVAGKIISTVMLAATIVVFVLGCFVTIFLDNHGSELFGLCFNTVSTDTYDSTGKRIVSNGDLVISKKVDASEYNPGELIVVKSSYAGEGNYSDIHIITSVLSVSDANAELTTTNLATNGMGTETISSEATYGILDSYIPALGTILHFAMDNAVLICVLFVLLAALWCLLLVLIENQKTKTKKTDK